METASAIKWAQDWLKLNGLAAMGAMEIVQSTPWSSVLRFSTHEGDVYLKVMPPALATEPEIITILYEYSHHVPTVLGRNAPLYCFLMLNSGKPLRNYLQNTMQVDLLCGAVQCYRAIQAAASNNLKIFFAFDVPDWRLEQLPKRYNDFIQQTDFLQASGVTVTELQQLHHLSSQFSHLCKQLSAYQITETLDHCDFHTGNVLLDEKNKHLTIIDWGETVITHPFFSLLLFIRKTQQHYTLNQSDYTKLYAACFDKANPESVALAEKIWPIYAAFGYFRLAISSDLASFKASGQLLRVGNYCREFIQHALDYPS